MVASFYDVDRYRRKYECSMRIASYLLAVERVANVYKMRGILS